MNRIYTIGLLLVFGKIAHCQLSPIPEYEIFTPDYTTYRAEEGFYSFNLIDYMFPGPKNDLWMSTLHEFKRTNGAQFYTFEQISGQQKVYKGHIHDGLFWNDSTYYLIDRANNELDISYKFSVFPRTELSVLDSIQNPDNQLLFYDVEEEGNAYELVKSAEGLHFVKVIDPESGVLSTRELPETGRYISHFSVARGIVWILLDSRKLLGFDLRAKNWDKPVVEHQFGEDVFLLYTDRKDRIWITQDGAIYQVDYLGNTIVCNQVLETNSYRKVFEDRNGNLIFTDFQYPTDVSQAIMYSGILDKWMDLSELLKSEKDIHIFAGNNFNKQIYLGCKNTLKVVRFTKRPFVKNLVDMRSPDQRWNFIARGMNYSDSLYYVLGSYKGLLVQNLNSGDEKLIEFFHPETGRQLRFDCLRTLEKDNRGGLWFTTCNGLDGEENFLITYNYFKDSSKYIPFEHRVTALKIDEEDRIWYTSRTSDSQTSLSVYDINSDSIVRTHLLPDDVGQVNDIEFSRVDTVWLASDNGVFGITKDKWSGFSVDTIQNAIGNSKIYNSEMFDNKLFLGSNTGLFIYDLEDSNVTHYSISEGMPAGNIAGILREKKDHYWVSTFNGLTKLNLKDNFVINYTTKDGLIDNEFNLNSSLVKDGKFYFGHTNGVMEFDIRDSLPNVFGDFSIKQFSYFNKESEKIKIKSITGGKKIVVPRDASYITLYPETQGSFHTNNVFFKLINYTSRDTLISSGKNGFLLADLSSGSYEVGLSAYDRFGHLLPLEEKYSIVVHGYFYKTVWFRFLMIVLTIFAVSSLIILRFKKLEQKKMKEVELRNKMSELELQVLQAQLNPHFIFNTVGTIQYYLQTNDNANADHYLRSFSKLMRMYLDSSKSSYIVLDQEIELLSKYIDLETIGLNGKIKSHYYIDPSLDTEHLIIPTMMIQPFVENAINHGLFHKVDPGNLHLRFIGKGEEQVICEIEDDGIGRKKSSQLKKNQRIQYQSRAMQIIDEKLEVLQGLNDAQIKIKILDKYQNSESCGTLVQIVFPVRLAESVEKDILVG